MNIPVPGGQHQCDELPVRGFHVCLHLHALGCELLRVGAVSSLAPCQQELSKELVPPQLCRGRMDDVSAEASGLAVRRPLQPAHWAQAAHSLGKTAGSESRVLVPAFIHSQPLRRLRWGVTTGALL